MAKDPGAASLLDSENLYDRLTERKRNVFQLLAEGNGNKDSANALGRSLHTVERARPNRGEDGFTQRSRVGAECCAKGHYPVARSGRLPCRHTQRSPQMLRTAYFGGTYPSYR